MVKIGGQRTKEFGGEIYHQFHPYYRLRQYDTDDKGSTMFEAERLRTEGYKARVLKSDYGNDWVIYVRKTGDVSDEEYIKKLSSLCGSGVTYNKNTKTYHVITFAGYKEYDVKTLSQVERILVSDFRRLHPKFPKYLLLSKKVSK